MLIGMENKGKFINLNSEPPNLRGLIKVHKTNTPIRPIANFGNAPSYKLAKMFTGILKSYIPLPNIYNVQNSVQLMRDLSDIPFVPGRKLASLDISDLYTNIPTEDIINIISNLCKAHNLDKALTKDILTIARLSHRITSGSKVIRTYRRKV